MKCHIEMHLKRYVTFLKLNMMKVPQQGDILKVKICVTLDKWKEVANTNDPLLDTDISLVNGIILENIVLH